MSIQSARGSLNVPGKNGRSPTLDEGVERASPSPSPPSPMGSREVSPEPVGRTIKTTELNVRQPSGEDLYSASPRLPKPQGFPAVVPAASAHAENVPSSTVQSKDNVDALGIGPSQPALRSLQTAGPGRSQGSTIRREVLRKAQEEKILIGEDGQEVEVQVDENAPPSMSATSYPGQEW